MHGLADSLNAIVAHVQAQLQGLRDDETQAPLKPGGWSRKQVLGHLIDSASNNHQRFVRLMISETVDLPGYEQGRWVEAQSYNRRPWSELLWLWTAYNEHLAHLIETVPVAALTHTCRIGNADPVTLEFLMRDYVRHLEHHIRTL
jgi:hypothetical protein